MKPSLKAALTLLVVLGLVVGGVALAQTDGEDPPAPQASRGYSLLLGRLAPLVEEGVISQQQAEAVADHLTSREHRGRGSTRLLEAAADILNMTLGDLREQLSGGATLADIAGGQTDALIAQLIDVVESEIEGAFDQGRITAEQRDHALVSAAERITRFVEEGRPGQGRFEGRGPRPDPGGRGPIGPEA